MFTADYEHATVIPAVGRDGNHWFTGRPEGNPLWVVIHGTAGGSSAQAIAQYFTTVPNSTHYTVGRDGAVVQSVAEKDSAWGNAPAERGCDPWFLKYTNPNYVTISIEHVKPSTDNSDQLTQVQQAASFALVKDICTRWHIPMRAGDASGGIVPHSAICPVDRSHCPGPYPWADLYAFLTHNEMSLPNGWTNDTASSTLWGPPDSTNTRQPVVRGFRNVLLTGAYWWLGTPRAPEFASANVRMNTTNVAGSVQFFEYGALCWERGSNAIYPVQAGDVMQTLLRNQIPAPNIQAVDLPQ